MSEALVDGRGIEACQLSGVVQLDRGCSALLVHPRLLLYPAHCGESFEFARAGSEQLAIERCQSYPDGGLFGSDLGFCVLRAPASQLSIIAPALGCEVEAITPGRAGWVVGFGATPTEPAGSKHISRGEVQAVNEEISIAGPGFAACPGDSGAPLLIEVDDGDHKALRVAGILSASSQEACSEAIAYFTPLAPFVAWIESESGFDLSPCGQADGAWHPSSDCRSFESALLESELCDAEQPQFLSATCGPIAAQNSSPSCQSVFVTRRGCDCCSSGFVFLACCALAARMGARRRALARHQK